MMRQQSFYDWLLKEIASSRMALISMYENRDHILYVEAPALRKKYMSIFGEEENAVLQSELETSLLRRKIELIQTAINRREPIDLEKIDEQINNEKNQRLSELEQNDKTLNELPQLSEQQAHTLKRLYHDITSKFHPAVHTDLTEAQRDLFQKAVEAFKMQDVDAMRIIHDSLFMNDDAGVSVETSVSRTKQEIDARTGFHLFASELTTDYSLAKKLYPLFTPLEDDIIVTNNIQDCNTKRKEVEDEIAQIRAGFPFNAVETMNNSAKIEEYRAELRIRAKRCEAEKAELQAKIRTLTEGRVNG